VKVKELVKVVGDSAALVAAPEKEVMAVLQQELN
jgi:hypothetical protein